MIPFNKPFLTGNETKYIEEAIHSGKISGNGLFTKRCQTFFEKRYGFKKCLMTTSCTDALEMCALLLDIKKGDEVIVPSYTFVSSALAFIRQGAKIVFADSQAHNPNLDVDKLEALISPKTKAVVAVHYAGIAVDMDPLMELSKKYGFYVVEDAAQAIESQYKNRPLGSIGHLSTFSFHETKNIIAGEGGLLAINDEQFCQRAEIIWEKGTNRASFFRGEVNKYGWVDTGSSFLPSEVISAFLFAQLENLDKIQERRIQIWKRYYENLKGLNTDILFPKIDEYATNNGHMFYILLPSIGIRTELIRHLKENGVHAVFHYLSLHKSEFYQNQNETSEELPNSDRYTNCLLRLPFFYSIKDGEIDYVCSAIKAYYSLENKSLLTESK